MSVQTSPVPVCHPVLHVSRERRAPFGILELKRPNPAATQNLIAELNNQQVAVLCSALGNTSGMPILAAFSRNTRKLAKLLHWSASDFHAHHRLCSPFAAPAWATALVVPGAPFATDLNSRLLHAYSADLGRGSTSQRCVKCRRMKEPTLGTFRQKPGCHRCWYWLCNTCGADKILGRPGRNRQPSPLERIAQRVLINTKLAFTREYELEPTVWYDFAVPSLMLLIEVDGSRTHLYPRKKARDAVKGRIAHERGWKLARVRQPDLAWKVQLAVDRREQEVLGK